MRKRFIIGDSLFDGPYFLHCYLEFIALEINIDIILSHNP